MINQEEDFEYESFNDEPIETLQNSEQIPEQKIEQQISETDQLKERLYKEKGRTKGLYGERANLQEENEKLKNLLSESMELSNTLYEEKLKEDLQSAGDRRKKAMEGEDADLFLKTEDVFFDTKAKLHDFQKDQNEQIRRVEKQKLYVEEQNKMYEIDQEFKIQQGNLWFSEYPELDSNSKTYDPKLREDTYNYVEQLDRDLREQGRPDLILTEDYFNYLDEFMSYNKRPANTNNYTKSNVGSTKNGFSNSNNGTMHIVLTEDEKEKALAFGHSEEEVLKAKIKRISNYKK